MKSGDDLRPRVVFVGLSDYEYAEVVRGLDEGDEVLLLGVLEMQAQREALKNRVRSRIGGGVTGGSGSSGGSSNRRGGS